MRAHVVVALGEVLERDLPVHGHVAPRHGPRRRCQSLMSTRRGASRARACAARAARLPGRDTRRCSPARPRARTRAGGSRVTVEALRAAHLRRTGEPSVEPVRPQVIRTLEPCSRCPARRRPRAGDPSRGAGRPARARGAGRRSSRTTTIGSSSTSTFSQSPAAGTSSTRPTHIQSLREDALALEREDVRPPVELRRQGQRALRRSARPERPGAREAPRATAPESTSACPPSALK